MRRARRDGQQSLYWTKKLLDVEERDPDRWGHSGFRELYMAERSPSGGRAARERERQQRPVVRRPTDDQRRPVGGRRDSRAVSPGRRQGADGVGRRRRSPSSSSESSFTASSSSRSRSRSPLSRTNGHRRHSSSSSWSTSSSTSVTSRSVSPSARPAAAAEKSAPPAGQRPPPIGQRPRESAPERPREPPRERPKEPPRDRLREALRERPREPPRERPRELPRERPREPPRERQREPPRESPKEPPRNRPREPPRDRPRESPRDRVRDGARGPVRAPRGAHSEERSRPAAGRSGGGAPSARDRDPDKSAITRRVNIPAAVEPAERRRARSPQGQARRPRTTDGAGPPRRRPPPPPSESAESSSSSGADEPPRTSLSERFGRLAQLSVQRGDAELVRLKIVKDANSSDKKVILEEEPGTHERSQERVSFETEYREYFGQKLRRSAVTDDPGDDLPRQLPRDWETDVSVRYRYYRDAGYFRDHMLTLEEYIKWEQWWYRYREWLHKEQRRPRLVERRPEELPVVAPRRLRPPGEQWRDRRRAF